MINITIKRFSLLISISFILLLPTTRLNAQIPGGYYSNINGLANRSIKTALSKIIYVHDSLSYNDMGYKYYPVTDVYPGGNQIWDMYSNIQRFYPSLSGTNREHNFPKSWWRHSDASPKLAYTDLHNLYPSDAEANMAKSNYPLGEVIGTPSFTNGVSKVGTGSYSGYAGKVFEPADQYKGDFARDYLYMATCYESYSSKWNSPMLINNTYPTFTGWAIELLLKWHRQDPVSDKEINRNNAVYQFQKNRNPFIDYPQLAEYIWGDSMGYVFHIALPKLLAPENNSTFYAGNAPPGTTVISKILFKSSNLPPNQPISVLNFGADSKYFKCTSTISTANTNRPEGYEFEISFTPDFERNYSTSLVLSDGGIVGSYLIKITGSGIATSIESADINSISVCNVDNGIVVKNKDSNSMSISIYSATGSLCHQTKCSNKEVRFELPQKGIYILKLNNRTYKISM